MVELHGNSRAALHLLSFSIGVCLRPSSYHPVGRKAPGWVVLVGSDAVDARAVRKFINVRGVVLCSVVVVVVGRGPVK